MLLGRLEKESAIDGDRWSRDALYEDGA